MYLKEMVKLIGVPEGQHNIPVVQMIGVLYIYNSDTSLPAGTSPKRVPMAEKSPPPPL